MTIEKNGFNLNALQNHLKEHQFAAEFQCINCESGYNDVEQIRQHMAKDHSSKFLFIASRLSKHKLIYIGDSCDYSKFKFIKCFDDEILKCMSPKLNNYELNKELLKSNQHQIKEFSESIPPIKFVTKDFFSTYKHYEMNRTQAKQQSTHYKCITPQVAKELTRIHNSTYKNLICNCSQNFEINEENGLQPFLDHLNDHHSCLSVENEVDIWHHYLRKHPILWIVYLFIDDMTTQLIRCSFQCNICKNQFNTMVLAADHYGEQHLDCVFDISTKLQRLVIASTDPNKPFASISNESGTFGNFHQFYCPFHNQTIGTKTEALLHLYNEHDQSNGFEFNIEPLLIEKKNSDDFNKNIAQNSQFQMYLFECLHCSWFVDSIDNGHEHTMKSHPTLESHFVPTKLVRCIDCKIVSTFKGIERHIAIKHQNMPCCPVNALNPKYCGLCVYIYRNNVDLTAHYKYFHANGETLTDKMLNRFEVFNANFDECTFETECCTNMKFDQLSELVNHMIKCQRRFICDECNVTFGNLKQIVQHYKVMHMDNTEEIIGKIQPIKHFLNNVFSKIRIFYPNGLVITRKSIENTDCNLKLRTELANILSNIWTTEAEYIKSL